ncbi:MAG TPA: HEAT repeat domain-containing protein, partial [Actinomycetota bacterium]|nr:HEAT repeat domain-containing protein [Actinomycetota bacterium]
EKGDASSDRTDEAGAGSGRVQAYEEDWYRSLKALAERQAQLTGEDEEEEAREEAAAPEEPTGGTGEGPERLAAEVEAPATPEVPAAKEQEAQAAEAAEIPDVGELHTPEAEAAPAEVKAPPADVKAPPSEVEPPKVEEQAPAETPEVPEAGELDAREAEAAPAEAKAPPGDEEASFSDVVTPAAEEQAPTADALEVPDAKEPVVQAVDTPEVPGAEVEAPAVAALEPVAPAVAEEAVAPAVEDEPAEEAAEAAPMVPQVETQATIEAEAPTDAPEVRPPDDDAASTAEAPVASSGVEVPVLDVPQPEAPEPEAPAAAEVGAEVAVPITASIPSPLPEPPPPPSGPSLTARDPRDRRVALEEIATRAPSESEIEQIAALVLDPDQDLRRLALEALMSRADRVDDGIVRQALQDPADEVRAVAVRLAAGRGSRDLALLAPLVGARRWPLTQATVMWVLPGLIASTPTLGEAELDPLLASVGEMDPPPGEVEREPFTELARALGVSRLVGALSHQDARRLGAVRLLAGNDAPEVQRALSALVSDPTDEIKALATGAADALARAEGKAGRKRAPSPDAPPDPAEAQRITSLARSLRDPDEAVAHLALSGLTAADRGTLLGWAREALRAGDAETASAAADTVAVLRLFEVALDVLNRAIELTPEARETMVDALGALRLADLVALLGHVDEARKPEAIRLLWQAGGDGILPHLRAHLDDPSTAVRMAVLEVLGEGSDPSSADVARFVLETDQSPALRAAAVRLIGRVDGEASSAVTRALGDPDPLVRVTALEELTGGLGPDADAFLLQALSDVDEQVRRAAMTQLASRPDTDLEFVWSAMRDCRPEERVELGSVFSQTNPGTLRDLALQHARSPDHEERLLAVQLAGWGNTPSCVETAIQALQDPVAVVRSAAAASLARLRDPSAVPGLGKALADPDPDVRIGVVKALGVIDNEAVLGFLVSALQDPEGGVQRVASEVLTQWSSPAVAKRLAGVLAAPGLRAAATELLVKIGPSSVELLIDVLLHGAPEVGPVVGDLLRNIVGLGELVGRLGSMEADARLRAVEAIGAIGGPEAVDALVEVLSDPDERIRIRSTQLLAKLGDPRAAEAIARTVLQDSVPEVAAAAEVAVARLGLAGDPQTD